MAVASGLSRGGAADHIVCGPHGAADANDGHHAQAREREGGGARLGAYCTLAAAAAPILKRSVRGFGAQHY